MYSDESVDQSTYADEIHLAERESATFISAIKEFGPEQARLSQFGTQTVEVACFMG